MTYFEAEQYLRSYKKFIDLNKGLANRRQELKSRLYTLKAVDTERDAVQGGEKNTALYSLIDKIIEIEQEMKFKEMEAFSKQWEIEQEIDKLNYPYCAILRRFYLENKTLEKIAVDLYLSYPHIKRLKRFGIEKFAEMQNEMKLWYTMILSHML